MATDDLRWYTAETDSELCKRVVSAVQEIDSHDADRASKNERCLRMYGQHHRLGESTITHAYQPARKMLALNVVRSIVDALHADLVQNRPRPMFLTGGSDMLERWTLQRRGRKLEQFVEGVFDSAGVYETTSRMALDAMIFDGSACKVFDQDGEVRVERVLPFELHVDPRESLYGAPRSMYQTKFVDRAVLRDLYPRMRQEIDAATRYTLRSFPWMDHGSDQVLVTEAWRLPNRKGKDGRHAIVLDSCVLSDDDWTEPEFPIIAFNWARMPVGFWGDSPANQLVGVQYEINTLLSGIQDAHHLLGKAKILWPERCGAVRPHWDNQIGTIIVVADASQGMPQVVAPQAVPADVYQHLERLYRFAYEMLAASQISAQARVPTALSGSGKSVEVYEDATSRRHIAPGRAYEDLHVKIARQIVRCGKRIYEREGQYSASWVGKRGGRQFVDTIDWAKVDMEESKYTLRVFPTSALSKSPSGRLRDVETWINMGWITPDEAMRLLDIPDVDAYASLRMASWDMITEYIDRMLDAEDPNDPEAYLPPEPFMDLQLALTIVPRAILRAKLDGAPDENIELLRRFVVQAQSLMPPPAEAPAEQAA